MGSPASSSQALKPQPGEDFCSQEPHFPQEQALPACGGQTSFFAFIAALTSCGKEVPLFGQNKHASLRAEASSSVQTCWLGPGPQQNSQQSRRRSPHALHSFIELHTFSLHRARELRRPQASTRPSMDETQKPGTAPGSRHSSPSSSMWH